MISRTELDYSALKDEDLQVQHFGRTVMTRHHLEALPKNNEGRVDITQLTCESAGELISPLTRFQRLVDGEVALAEIREELAKRDLEPWTPESK